MKIENIIKNNQGGTALFLGRVTNFTPEELTNFLEAQGLNYADKYIGQDVALLVLSSMLTPLEEDLSYQLYDMGVPDVTLNQFETFYTKYIKPNTLLMSLKLSNDQERLKRLLLNEAFTDEVFLKLFKMYDWRGDGLHESDDNRDVTIAFVKRFYRPDGFRDPAMIYAPTTIMNIAQESQDSDVLDAILTMPNHQVKVSRYDTHRPKNLRETIAFNEAVSQESIKRILSYRDDDIDYFLASNLALREPQQIEIYSRGVEKVKIMLAYNSNLSNKLFFKLLDGSDVIVKTLLSYQPMNSIRLEQIIDNPHIAYLGDNESVSDIVEPLLELKNRELDFQLASNMALSKEMLSRLYKRYGLDIAKKLADNINIWDELSYEFYSSQDRELIKILAKNPSTPKKILDELCEKKDRELNRFLASNPSVDIRYLREFQLDTSLIRILADNKTYGDSVLQGLGL